MVLMSQGRLLCLYSVLIFLGFTWFISSFEYFCSNDDLLELRERQLDTYKQQVTDKNREIENIQSKMQEYEEKLQRLSHLLQMKTCKPVAGDNDPSLPTLYLITPTYARLEQKADLTRLSHTLLHVRNLHWIVVEDSEVKTRLVTNFLANCGIQNTHLNTLTPKQVKLKSSDPQWLKPRGVLQRNAGLTWIRTALNTKKDKGVVYFADDDNTYSLELFEEIRQTQKVSVWPVGLVGGLRYESPLIQNGSVVGWHTFWKPERTFALDMAGFAVNLSIIFSHPNAVFSNHVPRGYLENALLLELGVKLQDLEAKADGCTKVLVWHTRTEKTKTKNEKITPSDINIEV
ncbi:galactosylgalactosylxylosylprotein 3-beta-glucuronosyltransferase 3-like [Ylistrum balloti]|uniref:galactosylgalactosylxylosylprotein 3-beta-glucuronosyltransferase 3-like n=1 Tax=Ylistrum balloti TaxID=509963 RepID=UPI002905A941|nr:galactosylgalactosylxylosylprotein 3-beta-glucuronosyltransferase 3-like [Ylistrum balloti]